MASKIVESPAGEKIEIVEDADWLALTGNTARQAIQQWYGGMKPYVIAELWLGGQVNNQSGRASIELHEAMTARFPDVELPDAKNLSGLMQNPTNAPAFERSLNGKRCYSIGLVALPDMWYRKMQADLKLWGLDRKTPPIVKPTVPDAILSNPNIVLPIDDATLRDEDITTEMHPIDQVNGFAGERVDIDALDQMATDFDLDAPTVFDIKPPLELTVAAQVAMSLLTTVVEIISAGSSESVDVRVRKLQDDLNDVAHKLSMRLSENDTLRRQVRESGDMVIALRTERDGLRSRLKATEANLTAALKGDAVHAINGEIMRRVDSIMRVAPSTRKGEDE